MHRFIPARSIEVLSYTLFAYFILTKCHQSIDLLSYKIPFKKVNQSISQTKSQPSIFSPTGLQKGDRIEAGPEDKGVGDRAAAAAPAAVRQPAAR